MSRPVCHVVAGPNGSGKSTFALDYLPEFAGSIEYVNPDLKAQGLSPTDNTLSALKAGGHDVPAEDVRRRYGRSVANVRDYVRLADVFRVFDASDIKQRLICTRNGKAVGYGPRVAAMRRDLGI